MLRSLDQLEQVDASRAGGVFCSGSIGGELKFESPGTLSAKEFLETPKSSWKFLYWPLMAFCMLPRVWFFYLYVHCNLHMADTFIGALW